MTEKINKFIEEHIGLIEQNTKGSWEEIYDEIPLGYTGEFTQIMLEAEIDPAEVLGYIPESYLKDCEIEKYEIPNNVISIEKSAFDNCTSLTNIRIPNNVTSIGEYAFFKCSSLTSITIPNSVTSIGRWAFQNCENLTKITVPNSITYIGNQTFKNCTSLTEIKYLGTRQEARTLLNSEWWTSKSSISKIICTDGEILL